jgi:tetratricopeptide (TPR) repeat protein
MKNIFITFITSLSFAFLGFSQVSNSEFEKAIKLSAPVTTENSTLLINQLEQLSPNDAKIYFLRGMIQFQASDAEAAIALFTKAIQIDENFSLPYLARACIFAEKGLFEKAVSDMTFAIDLDPTNAQAFGMRANYYSKMNKTRETIQDLNRKICLMPTEISTYEEVANIYLQLNQNSKAEAYFERAYDTKGINISKLDLAYGKYLMGLKRFEDASSCYRNLLCRADFEPSENDFDNFSIAFYKTKDFVSAIACSQKAISLAPKNLNYKSNLGAIYLEKKDWKKLKEVAKTILSTDEHNTTGNHYMATAESHFGNNSAAQLYLTRANVQQ